MKLKEEKICSLEKKVEESNKVNATLLAELSTVSTHATSHLAYQGVLLPDICPIARLVCWSRDFRMFV